jgi:hypothetical protein
MAEPRATASTFALAIPAFSNAIASLFEHLQGTAEADQIIGTLAD